MKCPNCGFETESAFCQMCGTKISEALHTQNNETGGWLCTAVSK